MISLTANSIDFAELNYLLKSFLSKNAQKILHSFLTTQTVKVFKNRSYEPAFWNRPYYYVTSSENFVGNSTVNVKM